jgi:hypothetical protein
MFTSLNPVAGFFIKSPRTPWKVITKSGRSIRFILLANSTLLVRLYVFGVDGSIYRPVPAPDPVAPPLPTIELIPFRPLIDIFVLGDADEFKILAFS